MPAINKYCSVFNGFNFRRDVHESIGHITKLKIADKGFSADFTLMEPEDESDAKVVGVLSAFDWEGGYAQPMNFTFQISIKNKNEAATLLHTEMRSIAVEICFNIYEYDKEAKKFYKSLHTNDAVVKGLLQVEGSERILYLADEEGSEVQQPLNYQLVLGMVPEDIKQDIQMAVAVDKKFVKPWGVERG